MKGVTGSIIVGLCIGVMIVVVLTVYPGKCIDNIHGDCMISFLTSFTAIIGQPLGIYNGPEDEDAVSVSGKEPTLDATVPTELETIPGISREQMKQIIQATQQQEKKAIPSSKNNHDDSTISIFSMIKMLIFTGLLTSLIYILNRDYNNVVTVWFIETFPRESSTFGLSLRYEL